MVATRRRRRRRRRNKPKVRDLRRFWYLETSWIMPDMHPMLLAWRVSAATFSLYEDDDTKVSCLFIDPQTLSLSLSVFMSKNCFGEMWKRAREVYLWLWGVAKQLAIDNGSKFINCFFFLFSFSFDNKFNWILGGKKERKKENGSDCYVCLISERKSKARGVLLKKLSFLEYTYIFMLPFSINFFCSFMHMLHHRSDHTFCPRWVSPPI